MESHSPCNKATSFCSSTTRPVRTARLRPRRCRKFNWKETKIIAIPTEEPQFAASFLHDTALHASTSNDLKLLRSTFQFVNAPYGVALERGRQKAAIASFEENNEPDATLRRLGFIE